MIFQGEAIQVSKLDHGIAKLQFDLKNESVNKFDLQTTRELGEAIDAVASDTSIKGLLMCSGKDVFIVGADITEFTPVFKEGDEAIKKHLAIANTTFNRIEDLPIPTVVAINGYALGGGCEVCLACDFRLMGEKAKIGLPETKLGILPGWGGTVRLPRLAGLDTAIEWIAGGTENRADAAFKAGVVDGVLANDQLEQGAITLLKRAIDGEFDIEARRRQKQAPLGHNDMEGLLAFESSKMFVKGKAGRNYPAPVKAIEAIQHGAKLERDEAQKIELNTFVELAKTPVAASLVGLFLSDQAIGKKAKAWAKKADKKVDQAAVLGAGIMGGGIAYQSAYKGVPIKMKDIAQAGIDLGLTEASQLLSKRVERGRMTTLEMAQTLTRIDPTLHYDGFDHVDLIVEAVVENPKVKKSVLSEVESKITDDTVLCSNTSTISINDLASSLKRPENFCGMHFFNPVHKMPLVEVIRGELTSDTAVARTVAYANALGKKAIVVNDCPGFLVNRVLFPYFAGFSMLVRDGADYKHVDKLMERWGWPMGPAYLLDVVGLDTGVHAESVMAAGFPERMGKSFKAPTDIMFANERLGQKNKQGFYNYELDRKGKQVKVESSEAVALLQAEYGELKTISDEEIIARMMVPMATELARCLEENVVESPADADMALIYGLGFPPFRGGIFRWIDQIGWQAFKDMAAPLEKLGPLYELTEGMKARAEANQAYYEN